MQRGFCTHNCANGSLSMRQPITYNSFICMKQVSISFCVGLQDDVPEASETFFVNLTTVELAGAEGDNSAQPSIRVPGNVAQITILENDNAQGTVQFDVKTVSRSSPSWSCCLACDVERYGQANVEEKRGVTLGVTIRSMEGWGCGKEDGLEHLVAGGSTSVFFFI